MTKDRWKQYPGGGYWLPADLSRVTAEIEHDGEEWRFEVKQHDAAHPHFYGSRTTLAEAKRVAEFYVWRLRPVKRALGRAP